MKTFFLYFLPLFFIISTCTAQTPTIIWDKTYGGGGMDNCAKIIHISTNSFLLFGTSETDPGGNKTSLGKGGFDYWLVKIDQNGNKFWDKTFGGAGGDQGISMLQAQDGNIILSGTSNSDISIDKSENSKGEDDYWIIKVDTNGNKLWDKTFGGNQGDFSFNVVEDKNGSNYSAIKFLYHKNNHFS